MELEVYSKNQELQTKSYELKNVELDLYLKNQELKNVENKLAELLSKLNEKLINNIINAPEQPLNVQPSQPLNAQPLNVQPSQPLNVQPEQPTQQVSEEGGRCIRKINRFFMKYF